MYVSKAGYRGKKTMIYVDRNGNRTKGTTGQDRLLKFIYTHTATRLLIRPFLSPWVSKLGGTFLSTRLSAVAIRPFVEKNQINLSQYEKQEFASYNEFFTRKIKAEERPVEMDEEVRFLYTVDKPVNLFPSIHCMASWFCCIGLRKCKEIPEWYKLMSVLIAISVFISTLATRQHVLWDVAGGIGVAELTWFISNRTNGWKTYQRLNEKISVGISRRLGR
jgi:membrane-associated phospholipid phosphatase